MTIRVLVVDDHPVVLDGVTLALRNAPCFEVVGYARTGREAIEVVGRSRPDVVVLDLRLPDMLAPEVVTAMLRCDPAVKVVLFTAHPEHAAREAAMAAGACGFVVKDTERADLVDVIRRVLGGEQVITDDPAADNGILLNRKLREHGLTTREYEILRRVAMGETNPQIAAALGLTRSTVKTYVQHTLEKLSAHNRIEALARANQLGIL